MNAFGGQQAGSAGLPVHAEDDLTGGFVADPTSIVDLPAPWGDDPFLLAEHGRQEVLASASREDALVVAISTFRGRVGVFGLGSAQGIAELLTHDIDRFAAVGCEYITLVRGAWERLSPPVQRALHTGHGSSSWDWMWLTEPTTASPGDAVRLASGARTVELVADCLSRAHPTASTLPGDPQILGWWGVPEPQPEREPVRVREPATMPHGDRDDVGRLIAVVGALELGPGLAPHLVSLGVDPQSRGRRLADAVMSAAVRDCLEMVPAVGSATVSLGLYASNAVARRVYERLGFKLLYEFTSRPGPD